MPREDELLRIVPELSPENFAIAVVRLARATDAELAEWDKRLPAAMDREARQREWAA